MAKNITISLYKGPKASMPSTGLVAGELLLANDKNTLWVATGATTKVPVVVDMPALASITAANIVNTDLMHIWDTSATNAEGKHATIAELKTLFAVTPAATFYNLGDSLALDGNSGTYAAAILSGNASFTVANLVQGVQYFCRIQASGADRTVTLPNTASHITPVETFVVPSGKFKEVAVILDSGSFYTWQVSETLNGH